MKKFIFIFIILLIFICLIFINYKNDKSSDKKENKIMSGTTDIAKNTANTENIQSLSINIDGKDYVLNVENNQTTKELIKLLPLNITMQDFNQNEKYYNLSSSLPTDEYNVGKIKKGDVMLYGADTLVIFYKDFDTSYQYTKIGVIENLDEDNFTNKNEVQVHIKVKE